MLLTSLAISTLIPFKQAAAGREGIVSHTSELLVYPTFKKNNFDLPIIALLSIDLKMTPRIRVRGQLNFEK